VQFYILTLLNTKPRHGYDLFKELQLKGLVKDRSDVYKTIRTMKTKGLISSSVQPSNRGYPKEILSLTEDGKDMHLDLVLATLSETESFMDEKFVRIGHLIVDDFAEKFIGNVAIPAKLLIDDEFGFNTRTIPLINIFFKDLNSLPKEPLMKALFHDLKVIVDVHLTGVKRVDQLKLLDFNYAGLKFIDNPDDLAYKHHFDILASLGIKRSARFHEKFDKWLELLSPSSIFIIILYAQANRPCPGQYRILAEQFTGRQREQFCAKMGLDDSAGPVVTNEEVIQRLEDAFSFVHFTNVLDYFDVFVAMDPKLRV
jgi:DNA-binding PadR family transcriptional regulator